MFDRALAQECRRAQRDQTPLSLLMIDIDHFKNYNDVLGHQSGDECLKQVAGVIAGQMLRPGDLAARYGGEEFAVILPSTPLKGALTVADRMLTVLRAIGLPHPGSPISQTITLSIGVTCAREGATEADILALADAALYSAKRSGRNQLVAKE